MTVNSYQYNNVRSNDIAQTPWERTEVNHCASYDGWEEFSGKQVDGGLVAAATILPTMARAIITQCSAEILI